MFKHHLLRNNMTQSSVQNLQGHNLSLILIRETSAASIFIEKDQTNPLHILLYNHSMFMALP